MEFDIAYKKNMAIVPCPQCDAKISDHAIACARCSYTLQKNRHQENKPRVTHTAPTPAAPASEAVTIVKDTPLSEHPTEVFTIFTILGIFALIPLTYIIYTLHSMPGSMPDVFGQVVDGIKNQTSLMALPICSGFTIFFIIIMSGLWRVWKNSNSRRVCRRSPGGGYEICYYYSLNNDKHTDNSSNSSDAIFDNRHTSANVNNITFSSSDSTSTCDSNSGNSCT